MRPAHPIDDEREISRWAMYSFANHAWVTTVGTVLIGPWLLALAKKAAGSGHATLLSIGPWHLSASAYPSFVLTVAALLQVLVLPPLGASVDALSVKKQVLAISCVAGSVIAALLATTGGSAWLYAGLVFLAGNVVFGASDVIYNSFLPQMTSVERRDAISSRGFAIGYLGSGLLLALNLALLKLRGVFGLGEGTAVRICFVSAGVWWAAFGLWAIRGLHERRNERSAASRNGLRELRSTPPLRELRSTPPLRELRSTPPLRELRSTVALLRTMPQVLRYLIAYLFFSDAISAVIGLASTYITHELYDDDATRASTFLFSLILLIQFLAIGGSLLFARLARGIGTKRAIVVTLVIWCFVIVYAYLAMRSKGEAVAMGVVLALVLGGSQALSRSLFSQMVPAGKEATFFGLYEICDRGTSWIAPALFTIVVNVTGSFRQAILSLIVLFVVGLVLLVRTDVDRARAEAATAPR